MLHLLGTYLLSLGGMLQPMRNSVFPKLQFIWDQGSLKKHMVPMASVQDSNLEVVSSKCRTGAGAATRKVTGTAD